MNPECVDRAREGWGGGYGQRRVRERHRSIGIMGWR